MSPTDADREKAEELYRLAFDYAMYQEGYGYQHAVLDEPAVIQKIAEALAEAREQR